MPLRSRPPTSRSRRCLVLLGLALIAWVVVTVAVLSTLRTRGAAPGSVVAHHDGAVLRGAGVPTADRMLYLSAVGDLLLNRDHMHEAALLPGHQGSKPGMIEATGLGYGVLWQGDVQRMLAMPNFTVAVYETPSAWGLAFEGSKFVDVRDAPSTYDYGRVFSGRPFRFNAHPRLAEDLRRAGVDMVLTANNHALDRGTRGVSRTAASLEAVGLGYVGTRQAAAGSDKPFDASWITYRDFDGYRVGFVGCWDLKFHKKRDAGRRDVLLCDRLIAERIVANAAANADVVAALVHWDFSTEYRIEPTTRMRSLAQTLANQGAHVILGSHQHVLGRAWEQLDGRASNKALVVWGLGNFVSGQHGERYGPQFGQAMFHVGLRLPGPVAACVAVVPMCYAKDDNTTVRFASEAICPDELEHTRSLMDARHLVLHQSGAAQAAAPPCVPLQLSARAFAGTSDDRTVTTDQRGGAAGLGCVTSLRLPFSCSAYSILEIAAITKPMYFGIGFKCAKEPGSRMSVKNCNDQLRKLLPTPGPMLATPATGERKLALISALWFTGGWRLAAGWVRRLSRLGKDDALTGMGVETHRDGSTSASRTIYRKSLWAARIEAYEKAHGCEAGQVTPITVHLEDDAACRAFLRSPLTGPERRWFMKDIAGTGGKGIDVLAEAQARRQAVCGERKILSQYVAPVWQIRGRKWDTRLYLLVASTDPLVVFWREGYLQASMKRFDINSRDKAVHITNPHFAEKLTQDANDFLWPFEETILQDLIRLQRDVSQDGSTLRGYKRYRELIRRVERALLMWVYAVKEDLTTGSGCPAGPQQTSCYQLMGFDVAFDAYLNPMILDTNTGPALRKEPEHVLRRNYPATAEMVQLVSTVQIAKGAGWRRGRQAAPLLDPSIVPQWWHPLLDESDPQFYERTSARAHLLRWGECHTKGDLGTET